MSYTTSVTMGSTEAGTTSQGSERAGAGSARAVAGVFRATAPHWVGDGFLVSSYFPRPGLPAERVSPFLLMDYGGAKDFPATSRQRGVGWHPHRGFETVTLAWEGAVEHTDNAGHSGVIGPGDVQWMTAASGILHQEYHAPEFARRGGRLHMMQLWVNLPRADKMGPPGYQGITAAEITSVALDDDAGSVRVIAGEFRGARGPAKTHSPVVLLDANLRPGARASLPLPAEFNAMAIVAAGRVVVGGRAVGAGELVLFENNGARLELAAETDAHVLVLAGADLKEPIVQHGPFVMNTREEIYQAMVDFDEGRFGPLPE